MNTLDLFLDLVGWIGIPVIFVWWLWSSRTVLAKCGHWTYVWGSVLVHRSPVAFEPLDGHNQPEYCLCCLGDMARQEAVTGMKPMRR